jgi:hypothetical protein
VNRILWHVSARPKNGLTVYDNGKADLNHALEKVHMSNLFEMLPGQIVTPAGADKLRGELLSAHQVRCGDRWMAAAAVYSDGAAEITVSTGYDAATKTWAQHEYYYSFEITARALAIFEQSGRLPSEDEL